MRADFYQMFGHPRFRSLHEHLLDRDIPIIWCYYPHHHDHEDHYQRDPAVLHQDPEDVEDGREWKPAWSDAERLRKATEPGGVREADIAHGRLDDARAREMRDIWAALRPSLPSGAEQGQDVSVHEDDSSITADGAT